MESLLTAYGIDFAAFTAMMKKENALVAGSFALAGYLKQEGLDPGFEPTDMDIFVIGHPQRAYTDDGYPVEPPSYRIYSLERIADFLREHGFTENTKFGRSGARAAKYYGAMNKIQRVVSFNNKSGKEIQVIAVKAQDLKQYMYREFDLSCCASYWAPWDNTFASSSPLTKQRRMYYMHEPRDEAEKAKMASRAKKYEERGFVLVRRPCYVHTKRDKRQNLEDAKFDGLTACDIFTMDDVPIRDWLAASDWNIILKAGEQFYAFERKGLMDLMNKHQTPIDGRIGVLYDTPLNQSITTLAYWALRNADHSIYELKPAYTLQRGTKIKSLYTLIAYTCDEWITGKEGNKLAPPPYQPPAGPSEAEVDAMLRNIADLFIGVEADVIIAQNPGLIPAAYIDRFKVIMQEINAPLAT
jgi:hypothetical protein